MWNYPHSLSYFNEIVGCSKNGFYYLAKSDCSWGQDLLLLRDWVDRHPEVENLHLAYSGPFDPRIIGFEFTLPPVGLKGKDDPKTLPNEKVGPLPGWYVVEVCFLYGDDMLPVADGKGGWDEPSKIPGYDLSYFLHFEPVGRIGYTLYIYHITSEDVERYNGKKRLTRIRERSEVRSSAFGRSENSPVMKLHFLPIEVQWQHILSFSRYHVRSKPDSKSRG